MESLKLLGFLIVLFFIPLESALAVSVEVSGLPQTLNIEDETVVNVKVTGAQSDTSNYLRGAFYLPGTTSYFGYTFNHIGDWFNGSPSDPKKFLQIQINSQGEWEGELKVKPDSADSGFKGNGNYSFKVGRYTENGTAVSTWSNELGVSLTGSEPTPTWTPTLTNIPTPTKAPTPTKTPIPTKTPTPSKAPTNTPTPTPNTTSKLVSSAKIPTIKLEKAVAGTISASNVSLETESDVDTKEEKKSNADTLKKDDKEQIISSNHKMPIIAGVTFLCSACGILAYRKYKDKKALDI